MLSLLYYSIPLLYLSLIPAWSFASGRLKDPKKELCSNVTYNKVLCSNFFSDTDLVYAVKNNVSRYRAYSQFTLKDCELNFLRSDTFKDVYYIEWFQMINSTLGALTDKGDAFMGLEGSLKSLEFNGCTFQLEWDWKALRNLRNLWWFEINNCEMEGLDGIENFGSTRLDHVKFVYNGISELPQRAFGQLPNLKYLWLEGNDIKVIQRSMLPNPAYKLEKVNFGHNRIEVLPKDLFTNMPRLINLYLTGNKILILEEATFSAVWGSLQYFEAIDIDLQCDCRLSWILQKRFPSVRRAFCFSPLVLQNRSIDTLTSADLYC